MSFYKRRGRPRKKSKLVHDKEEEDEVGAVQEGEEVSEDWCFVCKDGGSLIICDFKRCNKAYHPKCVEKDDTFFESGVKWICDWHSCFICRRSSKLHCFCCTNAVCKRCIKAALFVRVRKNMGFCNNCLKLAILIDEKLDVDSDGEKVDFKERNTWEFLFMEYWEIIKEKEGLTLDDLHAADISLKKGDNYRKNSDSDQDFDVDMDDKMQAEPYPVMEKLKYQEFQSPKKYNKNFRPKQGDFLGWASRPLIEFLASIGKKTSKALSQYEVYNIIDVYVHENKLTHPGKVKKVLCDARLHSLFGRKSLNKSKIYDLIEFHLTENLEESEGAALKYNFADKEFVTEYTCGRQKMAHSSTRIYEKQKVLEATQSCFASVTAKNIKLIYLRRSLIEGLLQNPETFFDKVIGSIVRVRSDSNDHFQRNSYQLLQVTGIKKAFGTGNISEEVILQVSNTNEDIPISKLSDEDFREEEIENLRKKMKDGLLKKLTIEEVEQKAKCLHESLMKYWIERELVHLQNLIDRANEKGWRRELFEYLERRRLLKTPSEQLRLLEVVPEVAAEQMEPEVATGDFPEHEKTHKSDLSWSNLPRDSFLNNLSDVMSNLVGKLDGNGVTHDEKDPEKEVQGTGVPINATYASDLMSDFAREGTVVAISVQSASDLISNLAREGDRNVDGNILDEDISLKEFEGDEEANANIVDEKTAAKVEGPGVFSVTFVPDMMSHLAMKVEGAEAAIDETYGSHVRSDLALEVECNANGDADDAKAAEKAVEGAEAGIDETYGSHVRSDLALEVECYVNGDVVDAKAAEKTGEGAEAAIDETTGSHVRLDLGLEVECNANGDVVDAEAAEKAVEALEVECKANGDGVDAKPTEKTVEGAEAAIDETYVSHVRPGSGLEVECNANGDAGNAKAVEGNGAALGISDQKKPSKPVFCSFNT